MHVEPNLLSSNFFLVQNFKVSFKSFSKKRKLKLEKSNLLKLLAPLVYFIFHTLNRSLLQVIDYCTLCGYQLI